MKFEIHCNFGERAYEVHSEAIQFHENGPAICLTREKEGMRQFLGIGIEEDEIRNDPNFEKISREEMLRFWNPLSPTSFDPELASLIVYFYMRKVSEK